MTKIYRTDCEIICSDHAGDRVCCAMITALTVSLVENITERLNVELDYSLEPGHFIICTKGLEGKSKDLVDAYWYSLGKLQESYPDNFTICT